MVLAMGGFTSIAPVIIARLLGAQVFLHESNSIPGRANRYLSRICQGVFVGFPETASHFSHRFIRFVGTPVRRQLRESLPKGTHASLGLDAEIPVLLIMGGSQGADAINRLMLTLAPRLISKGKPLQFIHLTGFHDQKALRTMYQTLNVRWRLLEFSQDMTQLLRIATAVLSRAGASSLAEYAALQIPAFLIPYPHAIDRHQSHNARLFCQNGAGRWEEQSRLNVQKLADALDELLFDQSKRRTIIENLHNRSSWDSACHIADALSSAFHKKSKSKSKIESKIESKMQISKTYFDSRVCEKDAIRECLRLPSSIFLVGAAGSGMSALGHLLLDKGFRISGSDLCENAFSRKLAERGAILHRGHSKMHLLRDLPSLLIYSSAIPRDHPERQIAEAMGIPTMCRGDFLAMFLEKERLLCVAGMHGKTTTTAMLAYALKALGATPNYAIGGMVHQLPTPARIVSDASWFVVEVDESNGNLQKWRPAESILLNIDAEHLDYFADVKQIHSEFKSFAKSTKGELLFCADDDRLKTIADSANALSYGFDSSADYCVKLHKLDWAQTSIERFSILNQGKVLGEFAIQLPGRANVSNAAAVIVWLIRHGFSINAIATVMAQFKGIGRRQQIVFEDSRFRLMDDYAHHPTAIRETLSAARRFSPKRLIVAFEPHRFTRIERLTKGFATCFEEADQVWITEIYPAHEASIAGVSAKSLARSIASQGTSLIYESSLKKLQKRLLKELRSGDFLLCLGAGDITQMAQGLAAELTSAKSSMPNVLRDDFAKTLSQNLPQSILKLNEPLAKRTTLKVGGPAEFFFEPASLADLQFALRCANHANLPVFILGRGSNLLIRDGGIRGLVISLSQSVFSKIEIQKNQILCGAAARLQTISGRARQMGLSGFEFLEGIPGTLGGALRMNAGAMDSSIFDVVQQVRFVDFQGNLHERCVKDIDVEYRACPLFKNHLAIEAILIGEASSESAVRAQMNRFASKRRQSQPIASSAGCIFKNPDAISAGKLIDRLGLKGTRIGGASVSKTHGNFIVNDGSASAEDVLKLIELVQCRARTARGIELRTEVQIVGK